MRRIAVCLFACFAVLLMAQFGAQALGESSEWTEYARKNGLYETALSRLGSRFLMNPRPQGGSWVLAPIGTYYAKEGKMFLVVESGGSRRYLPFSGMKPLCAKTIQKIDFTSISYTCIDPAIPADVTFSFISPFSQRDEKVSGAPFFYIRVSVKPKKDAELRIGVAYEAGENLKKSTYIGDDKKLSGLKATGIWSATHGKGEMIFDSKRSAEIVWAGTDGKGIDWKTGGQGADNLFSGNAFGFEWKLNAKAGKKIVLQTVISTYSAKQMMLIKGVYYRFKYNKLFGDAEEISAWATANNMAIEKKRMAFETKMKRNFETPSIKVLPEFSAFAFQSWLMNTWWLTGPQGQDWFSVWEGVCKGHSTLDVAYNEGPLYLELWPELLRMQIDEWPEFRRYPNIMPHDMGFGMNAGGQAMPHDMPVEENTNFIILLGAYWKQTGDTATVLKHRELLVRLVDYIIRADTNGNGFVDDGTANTIDSGIPATQYAPEQTYLATKTLAAMQFITLMSVPMKDPELAKRAKRFMSLTNKTLKKNAWLGDHFTVTLRRTVDFLDPRGKVERDAEGNRVWDGEKDTHTLIDDIDGNMLGWNAHSIYAANGFYYLFRMGIPAPVDAELLKLYKMDIKHSAEETLRKYGSTHTDAEDTMWVSQNIWMDMVAAYLGVDNRERTGRYWAFEQEVNQSAIAEGRKTGGCYTDTLHYGSGSIGLEYYPRGAAIFGWPAAWSGFGKAKYE